MRTTAIFAFLITALASLAAPGGGGARQRTSNDRTVPPNGTLDPRQRKELYTEATRIIREARPWLELFQDTTQRVSFRPRSDCRLIVAETTLAR